MRPRCEGGRVIAHARREIIGQLPGTVITHAGIIFALSPAPFAHRVAMVEAPFWARLVARLVRSMAALPARVAAVGLTPIVSAAEADDRCALRAGNPYKSINSVHARARENAPETCRRSLTRAPMPGLRPRATRRLTATPRGPSSFWRYASPMTSAASCQFFREAHVSRFPRFPETVHSLSVVSENVS